MKTVLAFTVSFVFAISLGAAVTNRVHVAEAVPVSVEDRASPAYAEPYAPCPATRHSLDPVGGHDGFAAPEWYRQWICDSGSTLWGIMSLAGWYASQGDEKKVGELHAYFLRVLGEVESARPSGVTE